MADVMAVVRPQMAAFYEGADLVRQTTLLAAGIAQNQPYVDGKKRTTCAATVVFLELNGRPYVGDSPELALAVEGLATRSGSLEEATDHLDAWLRANTR